MKRRDFVIATLATAASAALPKTANGATNAPEGTNMTNPANRPAAGYAPVNGVEIYYQIHGTGKPLVLLHGGLGAYEMFGPVLPSLTAARQVIGIDLQAHGRTRPFDRPMTHESMAADVAGIIEWLGYDDVDVVGYSLGGEVAMRLAIDHPATVRRLVLISAAASFAGWNEANQQGMKSISGAMADMMKQTPMYELYAQIAPDPTQWALSLDKMGELAQIDYDWLPELSSIKAPTLIVAGDWDAVKMAHLAEMYARFGGGIVDAGWDGSNMNANRMAIIPGVTHYNAFMDQRVFDAALAFIDA